VIGVEKTAHGRYKVCYHTQSWVLTGRCAQRSIPAHNQQPVEKSPLNRLLKNGLMQGLRNPVYKHPERSSKQERLDIRGFAWVT